jgi:hypothetical protein
MNSSTLRNSWHKLSKGDSLGLVSTLSSADDDDDDDKEEEGCVDNDEVEADGEKGAAWRSCHCACMLRSCASM